MRKKKKELTRGQKTAIGLKKYWANKRKQKVELTSIEKKILKRSNQLEGKAYPGEDSIKEGELTFLRDKVRTLENKVNELEDSNKRMYEKVTHYRRLSNAIQEIALSIMHI